MNMEFFNIRNIMNLSRNLKCLERLLRVALDATEIGSSSDTFDKKLL